MRVAARCGASSGSGHRYCQMTSPATASIALHHVPRTGEEHHAVVHQRRRLVVALPNRQHPGQPQLVDVVARDPAEGTVAVAVARPPPAQPVAGRRVREQRVGHRGQIVRHLPVDEPRRPAPRRLALLGRAPRLVDVSRTADRHRRAGGQRRGAGPGAVRIKDVRDQVQVDPDRRASPRGRGASRRARMRTTRPSSAPPSRSESRPRAAAGLPPRPAPRRGIRRTAAHTPSPGGGLFRREAAARPLARAAPDAAAPPGQTTDPPMEPPAAISAAAATRTTA